MDMLSPTSGVLGYRQASSFLEKQSSPSEGTVEKVSKEEEKAKLKTVCAEFESVFLQYMLKGMRATIPKSGNEGMGHAKEMYTSMMDEQLARELALKGGGIGLANVLFRQLSRDDGKMKSS